MRDDKIVDASPDKSPHERFTDLGKRLMAVPKSEVDKREAEWRERKSDKPSSRKKR